MILDRILGGGGYNSPAAYERHLRSKLRLHRGNRDRAFADAIGSETIELFERQGDAQVVRWLLEHGADPSVVNHRGATAAAVTRHAAVSDVLGA